MLWVLIFLAVLLLYIYLIMPSLSGRARSWQGVRFAHRGLHGNGISENTREAFAAACVHGFGIELDVQLSADGQVVVFHDDDLKRMTGDVRRVDQVKWEELKALNLRGGGHIPAFEEVLHLVNGRVPLLVELKNGKNNDLLCQKVQDLLRAYRGAFVVESFNPLILVWMRKNAPEFIRGQLVDTCRAYRNTVKTLVCVVLSGLLLNFKARPDFIAYNANARGFVAPRIQKMLFRVPMAAWTINTATDYRECLERGEMPIFEGFKPDDHR